MIKKIIALSISVLFVTFCFGCKKVEKDIILASKVETEKTDTLSADSHASSAVDTEEIIPIKPKKTPNISIETPKLKDQDKLEKLLEEQASAELHRQCGDTVDEISLTLTSEITTQNENFLSAVYQGDSEIGTKTNPKLVLFTQNIDLLTGKKLALADIVEVNEEFAKLAMDNAKATLDEVYADFIGSMTEQDWLARLSMVDTQDSFDYSSYMDGTLTVFFEMPPAAGDFLPVTNIVWEDWNSFAKNKSLVEPKEGNEVNIVE